MEYKFESGDNSVFKTLRTKVDLYFENNNIDTTGGWRLYIKGGIQVLSAIGIYVTLVFFTPPLIISLILCGLFGINLAALGFNVMHEGGHNSFSKSSWLNDIAAYSLNVLGGNIYFWKKKHNVNHHTYTNVEGVDPDIDIKPMIRVHEDQPLKKYHKFQHIYFFFFYGISYVAWVLYNDFQKYFSREVTPTSGKKSLPIKEHIIFWVTKVGYIGIYMAIPIYFVGFFAWIIGFATLSFVCGLTISIVFQLAHVVEETQFHSVTNQSTKQEWALHQLASTANFATKSKFLYWLLGGLNFQIEHHLFPRISHIHYPKISQIVKEVCDEYNIKYNESKTMLKAIQSHLLYLKRLGSAQRV